MPKREALVGMAAQFIVEWKQVGDEKMKRSVIYLCYQQRMGATMAEYLKRKRPFNEMRSTTGPCKVKLFGKKPRTYGAELPVITPIEKPILTSLGKHLAGF